MALGIVTLIKAHKVLKIEIPLWELFHIFYSFSLKFPFSNITFFSYRLNYFTEHFNEKSTLSVIIFTKRENKVDTLSVKAGDTIGEYGRKT